MEDDEMDSLFEGMVLFSPSQLATDQSLEDDHSESQSQSQSHHDAPSLETAPAPASSSSEPLDENLFSDLTLQTPLYQPSPSKTKSSRKKKKAAGLRIGYGRDSPRMSPDGDYDDDNFDDDSSILADETSSTSSIPDKDKEKDDHDNNPQQRFEHLKTRILEKLNTARELASSVSTARKVSIRRRRKASDDLHSASLKHSLLEKQLDEACEAEDFETAQRISDDLASSENHKQSLFIALRDAEAHCDAVDSQMHQVLLSQIAAEEESASLLYHFSADAANNADMFLKKAETLSSEEMDRWLSSTEALEGRKIELEIESHLVNDARLVLNNSVDASIEDDKKEKEFLCKRKDMLFDELQKLLALVRDKEKEIADNDSKIQAVEERIAHALSGFQEFQSSIDTKFDNLQSTISQLDLESEALLMKKKEIDEFLKEEVDRVAKLKELARVSAAEAKAYQEVVGLRRSLMSSVLKSRDDKVRLAKAEEKLSEEVQMLQQEVSAARASLQELSSMKSSIQQNVASFKQRILFIDKRAPELEAEKKVAAAARNFKEAARIAAEAKSLSVEKDGLQIEMEKAVLELEKLEENFKDTVERLQETEQLIISKEKEVAIARFQRLLIVAGAAMAERSAALELGNLEEANLLLGEAEAADQEAKKLKPIYNFREEEFVNLPKHFISMELVANFGKKQLAELAASVHLSSA
ncbi:hypothetical protein Pint_09400 [Pistacia integerrima]|uniref:Uncharacterized protein n=1 Tax=Pistacia integerrima TaxID=434235 RepID=A0ACC0XUQ3_9ROSI|nr:hypothetical protein Pint_09400 [Pistacia integerrima]